MSRNPERCPTTGALVDACRHCADDLPNDTPEHDDPEETAVPTPPPPVTDPERVEAIATLTWTVHVSADVVVLDRMATSLGLATSEVLGLLAAERGVRGPASTLWGGPAPLAAFDSRIQVSAVTLVDTDVQAIP